MCLAVCILLAAAAHAAEGPDVFGGYALSRRAGEAYHGVRAGLDFGLTRTLGLEVAAAAQRTSSDFSRYTDSGLMAGPRLHGTGRNAPFLTLSFGFVRTSYHFDGIDTSYDGGYTEPIVALDAGVDLAVGERWAVRLQAGLAGTRDDVQRFDYVEEGWQANPRGSVAIVWRTGR
jgi:hypothetical protein